mgnify:CR=1 FL=1
MESNSLFCIFCSAKLEEEAGYCAYCSEYKGVMTYEAIQKEYPELAKELVEANDVAEYFDWLQIGIQKQMGNTTILYDPRRRPLPHRIWE